MRGVGECRPQLRDRLPLGRWEVVKRLHEVSTGIPRTSSCSRATSFDRTGLDGGVCLAWLNKRGRWTHSLQLLIDVLVCHLFVSHAQLATRASGDHVEGLVGLRVGGEGRERWRGGVGDTVNDLVWDGGRAERERERFVWLATRTCRTRWVVVLVVVVVVGGDHVG
jgi:hypothetical protein